MEYVRVRQNDTGHHISIPRSQFNLDKSGLTELKQDATFADGTPIPPKHHTTVETSAAKKSGKAPADNGQSADTSKEK